MEEQIEMPHIPSVVEQRNKTLVLLLPCSPPRNRGSSGHTTIPPAAVHSPFGPYPPAIRSQRQQRLSAGTYPAAPPPAPCPPTPESRLPGPPHTGKESAASRSSLAIDLVVPADYHAILALLAHPQLRRRLRTDVAQIHRRMARRIECPKLPVRLLHQQATADAPAPAASSVAAIKNVNQSSNPPPASKSFGVSRVGLS